MKKERYIVEIEMPEGDAASSMYIHDVIQSDCDIEDEGRWKVSVKEYWKPTEEQVLAINTAINVLGKGTLNGKQLIELYQDLKKL